MSCEVKSIEDSLGLCHANIGDIPSDFSDETPYVFNVFFHKIVANDGSTPDLVSMSGYENPDGIGDGDLITEREYLEAIRALNIKFNKFNIFFKYFGNDIIPNSDFLDLIFHIDEDISNYDDLQEYVRNNTDENGEIYYKENSLNLYIANSINLNNWGRAGSRETESYYAYKTFQPIARQQWNPGSLVPEPYDRISMIVPHEIGHNFFLFHTNYSSGIRVETAGRWAERVTRDVLSPHYNADDAGDDVADTNASTTGISNPNTFADFENCTCNQQGIIDEDIRDWSDYIIIDGQEYPNGELFQLEDQIFNLMSSATYFDLYEPSNCQNKRTFTNGQGLRMRCIIEQNQDVFNVVQTDIASLYEPYRGDYGINGETNNTRFQPGFDYEFVECSNGHSVPTDYGNHNFQFGNIYFEDYSYDFDKFYSGKIKHLMPTAIRIIQLNNQPEKCYNQFKNIIGGKVIKFNDNVINTNVTITPKNAEDMNDNNLIQNLQQGLYKIEKNYDDGSQENKTILKQND